MSPTKTTPLKNPATESEQALHFLSLISDQLKQQRRHFDDAVVTHCIRLIQDYLEENGDQDASKDTSPSGK